MKPSHQPMLIRRRSVLQKSGEPGYIPAGAAQSEFPQEAKGMQDLQPALLRKFHGRP